MPTCGYRVFPSTKGNKIKMEKNEATALAGSRDEASTNKKMCIDLATMPGTRQELSRARTTKKDDAYKFVILDATATFINLKFNFKVVKSLFFCHKTWSLETITIASRPPVLQTPNAVGGKWNGINTIRINASAISAIKCLIVFAPKSTIKSPSNQMRI